MPKESGASLAGFEQGNSDPPDGERNPRKTGSGPDVEDGLPRLQQVRAAGGFETVEGQVFVGELPGQIRRLPPDGQLRQERQEKRDPGLVEDEAELRRDSGEGRANPPLVEPSFGLWRHGKRV